MTIAKTLSSVRLPPSFCLPLTGNLLGKTQAGDAVQLAGWRCFYLCSCLHYGLNDGITHSFVPSCWLLLGRRSESICFWHLPIHFLFIFMCWWTLEYVEIRTSPPPPKATSRISSTDWNVFSLEYFKPRKAPNLHTWEAKGEAISFCILLDGWLLVLWWLLEQLIYFLLIS